MTKYTFGWHRPNGEDGVHHLVIMRDDQSIPGCKPPSAPFKGAFPWEYNWLIDTERSNIALANQRAAAHKAAHQPKTLDPDDPEFYMQYT